jgi:hypothetical protein
VTAQGKEQPFHGRVRVLRENGRQAGGKAERGILAGAFPQNNNDNLANNRLSISLKFTQPNYDGCGKPISISALVPREIGRIRLRRGLDSPGMNS